MFIARMSASTTKSAVVFQVVDLSTGRTVFVTRHPDVAVRVAARCNTGDTRVFSSDFGDT